ncbi:MAG: hypothetical protein WD771_05955 [Gemmatimonadaceae bacterium]
MGMAQGGGATPAQQAPVVPTVPQSPGAATGATPAAPAPPAAPAAPPGQPGTEAIVVQPPPYRVGNEIPAEVIPILGIVSGTLIALVIGYPIVRLITRLIERRTDRSLVPGDQVALQLRQLQDSVDTMAIELERISEAQRFSARLLAERGEKD